MTLLGRLLAIGLMMGGLVVLGVTSATVISALTDQVHRTRDRLVHERDSAARAARDAHDLGSAADGDRTVEAGERRGRGVSSAGPRLTMPAVPPMPPDLPMPPGPPMPG